MDKQLKQIFNVLITIAAGIIGYNLGIAYFILLAPILLGIYVPKWCIKKKINIKHSIIKFIAWSNIITWFVPIVGLFTSCFILSLYQQIDFPNKKKYKTIAIVGLTLTVINSASGFVIKYFNLL